MKTFVAIAALALLLSGCGTPLRSRGEYNVGACAEGRFIALHVKAEGSALLFQDISIGPKLSKKIEPVEKFEYTGHDVDGYHYVLVDEDGKFELVLKYDDKGVSGTMSLDGEKVAKFYGAKGSESDLVKAGLDLYSTCQGLQSHQPQENLNVN